MSHYGVNEKLETGLVQLELFANGLKKMSSLILVLNSFNLKCSLIDFFRILFFKAKEKKIRIPSTNREKKYYSYLYYIKKNFKFHSCSKDVK